MRTRLIIVFILAMFGLGFIWFTKNQEPARKSVEEKNQAADLNMSGVSDEKIEIINARVADFSKVNSTYRFSAEIPNDWQIEYVPGSQALNIYDPKLPGNNLDKSRLFIRFFEANDFLTLSTVNILQRQEVIVSNHKAVWYEIEKKESVKNFANQPLWRSERHKLVDIRFANTPRSLFYVFAYSPEVGTDIFNEFVQSLVFHNDQKSFSLPMNRPSERITKKPFGLKVSPDDSPVAPERFSGYHTAVDLETFENEQKAEVPVKAICGGFLRQKRQASGYGGLAVEECQLADKTIWVVYGHVDLASVAKNVNDYLSPGESFAYLGEGGTAETDGERKHLHLGMNFGSKVNISGYVQVELQLSAWINPQEILPF